MTLDLGRDADGVACRAGLAKGPGRVHTLAQAAGPALVP